MLNDTNVATPCLPEMTAYSRSALRPSLSADPHKTEQALNTLAAHSGFGGMAATTDRMHCCHCSVPGTTLILVHTVRCSHCKQLRNAVMLLYTSSTLCQSHVAMLPMYTSYCKQLCKPARNASAATATAAAAAHIPLGAEASAIRKCPTPAPALEDSQRTLYLQRQLHCCCCVAQHDAACPCCQHLLFPTE
jgi:hypothetical protein